MSAKKHYYIGLDLGVGSVGWAVVNEDNRVIRKRGKKLWGVRLFEEAETAENRRLKRRQRRTISKRSWRLSLLKKELSTYVLKEDKGFFNRLKGSQTKPKEGYFLFDGKYNDTTYMREFPTIFHLRLALMDINKVNEFKQRGIYYRLLYLASSDILKTRGHFLSESKLTSNVVSSQNKIIESLQGVIESINEEDIILDEKLIIKSIKEVLNKNDNINKRRQDPNTTFIKALLGYKFNINRIVSYNDDRYDHNFDDENWEEKITNIAEIDSLLHSMFEIYSMIRLFLILEDQPNISSSKVEIYNRHKKDLKQLKGDIKKVDHHLNTNHFNELFRTNDIKKVSYTNYVGKFILNGKKERVQKKTTHEELIRRLKTFKGEIDKVVPNNKLLLNIEEEGYLELPTNADNRLIPYQVHYNELDKILENFVRVEDSDGSKKIKDRVLKIMKFKVPYFVGPLSNKNSKPNDNYWLVKKEGYEKTTVTPFNFDDVVDKKRTNEEFIKRMLRNCTYLQEEPCMQQETILYQTYIFYNTVNKIKINGTPLTKEQKDILYNSLLSSKSLSKGKLLSLLNLKEAEVSGFSKTGEDKPLSISLSAIKRFRTIFPNHINNEFYINFYDDVVNDISFIDDNELENKKSVINNLLKSYKTIEINNEQFNQLTKIKSERWGNLSYALLNELLLMKDIKTGEMATVMDILKDSDKNLMEVLFIGDNMTIIDNQNDKDADLTTINNVHEYLKTKYISPQARRAIIQAVRIVDEIIKIMGGQKPKNIAIEFTRENQIIKRETSPRLKELKSAYLNIEEEYKEAINSLTEIEKNKQDDILRARKIYLYFLQLGKDVYTGEQINFNELLTDSMKYNIDHIFPQSRIKDDSFDNIVLTTSVINGEMGNNYPIPKQYQDKNYQFWSYLVNKGLMSQKKFARLTRTSKLTDQELEDFVNRQKTTLDWINKETAELLKIKYGDGEKLNDFIIFSKSRHAYDFRQIIELYKFRELNNFHHAHDAYLNILIGRHIKKNLYVDFNGKFKTYNYKNIIKRIDKDTIKYAKNIFGHHDVLITKKTKINNKGSFWDEQIVAPREDGKNHSLIPLKEGMDVNKYGGYRSASTAFFSVLENPKHKIIMPIPTYHCDIFYDGDIFNKDKFEVYVREHYPNHKIIENMIPIGQKVMLNGVELLIASKGDTRIGYHNTGELILKNDNYDYLRKLMNTRRRFNNMKITEDLLILRNINKKDNLKTFMSISKAIKDGNENHKIFSNHIYSVVKNKEENMEKFSDLSLIEQFENLGMITSTLVRGYGANGGRYFKKTFSGTRAQQKINYDFAIVKESITGFYKKVIDIHVQDSSS